MDIIKALDQYLYARQFLIDEEAKGTKSHYWNDTYGFGNCRPARELKEAEKELRLALSNMEFVG